MAAVVLTVGISEITEKSYTVDKIQFSREPYFVRPDRQTLQPWSVHWFRFAESHSQ